MQFDNILVEKDGGITTITLNRPQALNALSVGLCEDMIKALKMIKEDPQTEVVIITGAGRAFCAGADIKELRSLSPQATRYPSVMVQNLFATVAELEQPIIAAIHGYTLTGGLELTLSCDMVIAAEDAILGDTHPRVGRVPGGGNSQRLPRIMGVPRAMEFLLACRFYNAQEALQAGLVSQVVPKDKLLESAKELARKVMEGDKEAVRAIKRLVREGMRMELGKALLFERLECNLFRLSHSPEDLKKKSERFFKKE